MKTLHVQGDLVVNVSVGEPESTAPDNVAYEIVEDDMTIGIGWTKENGLWIAPAPDPRPSIAVDPWKAFDDRLVIQGLSNPESPYRKITAWAKSLDGNYFLDSKNNIAEAISRKSIDVLQFAMADLKSGLDLTHQFTTAQKNEIDACLQILGVDWRWGDL